MEIKITKMNKIHEVDNCMCHNYYFVYYGRIYNDDKTRYKKFKYVEWFDIFDVMDFFEKEFVSSDDIREYANNIENSYLWSIKDYKDEKGLKEFYNYCNESIKNYNSIIKNY